MGAVLVGVAALIVVLLLLQGFTRIEPRLLIRGLRVAAGSAALAGAALLAATERFGLAVPLGFVGLSLLGWLPRGFSIGSRKSPGQVSRVRSAFIEMELDHDTGAMRGKILAGPHEGAALDQLSTATLVGFLADIDEESQALLATYLDRRDPSWREHAQGDAAAGRGSPPRGPMTHQEAYQILGLEPGASTEDIVGAHRTLMKKLHPDLGGTNYLAARVNEAKDTLLRQHR
jgi:hypothetical protein